MNCDYCDGEVVVKGVKDREYYHTHGGLFCLTNVATVDGRTEPLTEAEVLANVAQEWLGKHGSSQDAFDKASGWTTDSWRIVANGSYDNHLLYKFSNPTEIKVIFGALVILAKKAGIEF